MIRPVLNCFIPTHCKQKSPLSGSATILSNTAVEFVFTTPSRIFHLCMYGRYTVYQANGPFKIIENLLQKYIFVGCAQQVFLLVTKHFIVVHVQPWYSSDHKHAQIINMHINTEEIHTYLS